MNDQAGLANLIQNIAESRRAPFYARKWRESRLVFNELPHVTTDELIGMPTEERTYIRINNVAKIIHTYSKPFIIEWNQDSLRAEYYGDTGTVRPLVLLNNGHEALEKSMWFYTRNVLPLIGEIRNLPVAAYAASKYQVDAIVTDESIIQPFVPILAEQYALERIRSLTLMGSSFNDGVLPFILEKFGDCRLLLALPEVGSIAESCPESLHTDKLVFHPVENCVTEFSGTSLVVTKTVLLPTPIIKYATSLVGESVATKCSCNTSMSFVLG